MAKVRNALFSQDASGRLGRHFLVSRPYGVQVVRRIRLDALSPLIKTASAAQEARRILYAQACDEWQLLTPEEKASWQLDADARSITAFSAFVSTYLLAPPSPPGTIWDSGTTTWDGGTTLWDTDL
jgi:hypothetical protein